jgi:hypothetical protein
MRKRLAVAGGLLVIAGLVLLARSGGDRDPQPRPAGVIEAPEGSPSLRAIPRSDLPPQGTRSLFDHVLKENGGLPYPFDKLLDLIARYDVDGRRPAAVLIPDGRSLLKAQASFEKPRIVAAADARPAASEADLGLLLKGRLFLGFVEEAREIEVISYNQAAGRYEFQLVRDYYEGGVPRITYAKRSLCITCHRGETPIFPVRPWDETNAQPAVTERVRQARGVPPSGSAEYFGVPIVTRLESAETIDDLVNLASVVPTTQRIWIDGCGEDAVKGVDCRRQMLLLAVRFFWNPADFSPDDPDVAKLLALQREFSPAPGIPVPNPSLLNRNPFLDGDASGGLVSRIESFFDEKASSPKGPGDLTELAPVRPELDPLRPRLPRKILSADDLDGVYGISALLGANDRTLLDKASGGDFARIEAAVRSDRLAPHLGPAPFRRVALMKALLTELGAQELPASSGESAEGMSPPLAEGGRTLTIAAGSPLEPFERYCFGCHRGNPAARLDFMSGDSEGEVLAKIKQVSEMREVLDYERYLGTKKESRLMPPEGSYQRKELERARAAAKDDLKRMVEVIPGLFE